jgi:hypothetical protein
MPYIVVAVVAVVAHVREGIHDCVPLALREAI